MLQHHCVCNSLPFCKLWPMAAPGGAFARFCGWRTDLKRVNAFLMAPFIIENCFAAPYPLESPKFGQNHEREWTSDPISQPPLHPKSIPIQKGYLRRRIGHFTSILAPSGSWGDQFFLPEQQQFLLARHKMSAWGGFRGHSTQHILLLKPESIIPSHHWGQIYESNLKKVA